MTAAKYPRRLIALGPPYDDGTVPQEGARRRKGHDPSIQRAVAADQSGITRPSNAPSGQYIADHHPAIIGRPPTTFDQLQREVGLAKLDNEVLRDLLEVAWTALTTLAPTGQNAAADALRARIWAHLHEEEASCPRCHHYLVNHEAAGPCACEGCDCQGNQP